MWQTVAPLKVALVFVKRGPPPHRDIDDNGRDFAAGEYPTAIYERPADGSTSVTLDRYCHFMDGLD